MSGLSNGQQALMMLTAFLVPLLASVASWSALGMPVDRTALGMLASAICGDLSAGIIVFAKEILGGKAPETSTPATTPTAPTLTTTYGEWTQGKDLFSGETIWYRNVYHNGVQYTQEYSTTDPTTKITPPSPTSQVNKP